MYEKQFYGSGNRVIRPIKIIVFLTLALISMKAKSQYKIDLHFADKDTLFYAKNLGLDTSFTNSEAAVVYINRIPTLLMEKGYATSSVDSVAYNAKSAYVLLYLGEKYRLGN